MLNRLKKFLTPSFCRKIFSVTTAIFLAGNFYTASASVKLGDRGDEVKEVQTCLIAQELLSGTADGVCGAATVQAIKDFQSAVGLPVDGVCGPETFRLLRAAAYGEIDITDFMVENNSTPNKVEEGTSAEVGDVIKQGMTGAGVVDVQKKLISLGFLNGSADGICGAGTVQAIKNFQSSVGMTADGICGIMTYAALENAQYSAPEPEYTPDYSAEYSTDENFGEFAKFNRVLTVEATAYSSQDPGLGAHTAMGTPVRHGVIAVDPYVIPLGTRVYIPGYGEAVAEDVGGAIVGHRIDIAFDTYNEVLQFGKQTIEIFILDD